MFVVPLARLNNTLGGTLYDNFFSSSLPVYIYIFLSETFIDRKGTNASD